MNKKNKTPPKDFYIQITRDCIHDCIFCSAPKAPEYLSLDEIKKRFLEYKKLGYTDINITGGEPTLHPDLEKIIKLGVQLGFQVRMTTNGVLLADMDYLKRLKDAGLNRILFSVHHYDPKIEKIINNIDHEDFQETLKAIENADKLGMDININITVIRQNYKVLRKIVELLVPKYKNVHHFNFNFVDITGNVLKSGKNYTAKDIAPRYSEAEKYLLDAFNYLKKYNVFFRFERAPLCYATGFEDYNSEANRAVGAEYHVTSLTVGEDRHFNETTFKKSEVCDFCYLNDVCFGVETSYAKLYGLSELHPVFVDPNEVAFKVKRQNNYQEPIKFAKTNLIRGNIRKMINSDGGFLSFLRNDLPFIILYHSNHEVDYKFLNDFIALTLEENYKEENIFVFITKKLNKSKILYDVNFVDLSDNSFAYVYSPRVIRRFKVPKIFKKIFGIVLLLDYKLTKEDVKKFSAFNFIFDVISEDLHKKLLSLSEQKLFQAIMDIFSVFKPKIKMVMSKQNINEINYLAISRDVAVHDYLFENLTNLIIPHLDFVGERYLGPENVGYVSFNEIDIKDVIDSVERSRIKHEEVVVAKNDNCSRCYLCIKNCPKNAIKMINDQIVVFADKCDLCKICFDVCPNDQFELVPLREFVVKNPQYFWAKEERDKK